MHANEMSQAKFMRVQASSLLKSRGSVSAAGCDSRFLLCNICIWTKTNADEGWFYRSQHEMVFVFQASKCGSIKNIELGNFGCTRANIWTDAGVNTFHCLL